MDKFYGSIIWTNHALDRMNDRGIKQSAAWATWRNPDQSEYAKTKGAWIYYKTFIGERIEVVAKKNDEGKWVVLSVWSKTVFHKKEKMKKDFSVANLIKSI